MAATALAVTLFCTLSQGRDASPVHIEAGAETCPSPGQVQAALVHPSAVDRPALDGWTVRYSHADPALLSVEVVDAAGLIRTQRRVEISASSCAVAAQIIAAISWRAAQPVTWGRAAEPTATLSATGPGDGPDRVPSLNILVGPAIVSGPASRVNLLVSVGGRIRRSLGWWAGWLALPATSQEAAGNAGRAELRQTTLLAALTWTGAAGPLDLQAGPLLSVNLDGARTTGVAEPSDGVRGVLNGGGLAGTSLALGRGWRLGLAGAVWGRLASSRFVTITDDGSQTVLRPPAVGGLVAVQLKYALMP